MHKLYTTPGGKVCCLFKDMLSRPHLLIAGETGSGKSVLENGLICTVLRDSIPGRDAALVLIDTKRVELSPYKDLPHVWRYADSPESAVSALQYALTICEDRYRDMQRRGLRLYDGGKLYIFIDEFADLMTTAAKQVKPLVQRIAQIGRGARVMLICCTQSPIAKIIPTEIRCNFDCRIGLRTKSAQDSRNILGYSGLENLPQYGQGVYLTPEADELYNIPYIDEREQQELISYWTDQKKQANKPRVLRWLGL